MRMLSAQYIGAQHQECSQPDCTNLSAIVVETPEHSKSAESTEPNGTENQRKPVASTGGSVKPITSMISPKKLASQANGKNTLGPKKPAGKAISSWNTLNHGLLSKRLVEFEGQKKEQFYHLLAILQQDLELVGALEQVLVETIAYQ